MKPKYVEIITPSNHTIKVTRNSTSVNIIL